MIASRFMTRTLKVSSIHNLFLTLQISNCYDILWLLPPKYIQNPCVSSWFSCGITLAISAGVVIAEPHLTQAGQGLLRFAHSPIHMWTWTGKWRSLWGWYSCMGLAVSTVGGGNRNNRETRLRALTPEHPWRAETEHTSPQWLVYLQFFFFFFLSPKSIFQKYSV